VWPFNAVAASPLPRLAMAEVSVGEATALVGDAEAAELVGRLVEMATA
jgi:hypothetical protein